MIRVLLAEDQTLVRDGLCALLELQGDFAITAVADGEEALAADRGKRPDVAVLDVRMPVLDGIECTRRLKAAYPDLPILILTTYDERALVRACLEAGAAAYLLKDVEPDDLANALRLLHAGERLIPGDLARALVAGGTASGASASGGETEPAAARPPDEPLTPRQHEILELIAAGLSNREIAGRLYLSEGTVKNAVSEIYARLNVRDRVQAALKAIEGRRRPGG